MRAIADGEESVKAAGQEYLDCPPTIRDGDGSRLSNNYNIYKSRAEFIDAVGPSRDYLLSRLFTKDPAVNLAGLEEKLSEGKVMDLAKTVAKEIAEVGRVGVAVDYNDLEQDVEFCIYKAEQIVNWKYNKANQLILVVLEQSIVDSDDVFSHKTKKQRVVLGIDDDGHYYSELYVQASDDDDGTWLKDDDSYSKPKTRDGFLEEIPFYIFSTSTVGTGIERSLLEPMANIVLQAYGLSASFRNALHLIGVPTPYVADDLEAGSGSSDYECLDCGQTTDADIYKGECGLCGSSKCRECGPDEVRLGSSEIYYLSAKGKIAFAEIQGSGLGYIENELKRSNEKIVSTGARMYRLPTAGVGATATSENNAEMFEKSRASALANSLDRGMVQLIEWAYSFLNVAVTDDVGFETDKTFGDKELSVEDLIKLVSSWGMGQGMSLQIVVDVLKRSGHLAGDVTPERYIDMVNEYVPGDDFADAG